MSDIPTYLRWLCGLCLLMGTFGFVLLAAGFREPSFGKVATVVVLYVAAVVLFVLYRHFATKKG